MDFFLKQIIIAEQMNPSTPCKKVESIPYPQASEFEKSLAAYDFYINSKIKNKIVDMKWLMIFLFKLFKKINLKFEKKRSDSWV